MSHTQHTDQEGHQHIGMEEARAGETTGRVRIVLAISSLLAIVALGIVVYSFAHPAMPG